MEIEIFKTKLKEKNISYDNYSFNEGLKDNAYILDSSNGYWKISYRDERGNEEDLNNFLNESEALDYVYNLLLQDFGYKPIV